MTGNHEYYSGADEWIAHVQSLGMRVLRNERVDIRGLFDLAGVDDWSAGRMLPHHGQDVAGAARGRDPSRPLVLLAHQPKALDDAVKAGVDLQLSGHVHGGNTGTGYWGPPMRVGTRAEITRLELVAQAGAAA